MPGESALVPVDSEEEPPWSRLEKKTDFVCVVKTRHHKWDSRVRGL